MTNCSIAYSTLLAAALSAPTPTATAIAAPKVTAASPSSFARSSSLAQTSPPEPSSGTDYEFQPLVRCPYCAATPAYPQGRYGLHWHDHWRRVGLAEYIITPVLFATAAAFGFGIVPEAREAAWTRPILFDTATRRALELKSRFGRAAAGTVSDAFLYASFAQTMALDNLVIAWAGRNKPGVAWQMFVINSQAYALTLALNAMTKRVAARKRPFGKRCGSDGGEFDCKTSDEFQSFYSGHAAVTATAAGLVCTHHTQLYLYANPYADAAACATSVALTLATGALRISSENHWASDVLAGELMGFASGYVLPTLVYYREFRATPRPPPPQTRPRVAILPLATANSVQVAAVGVF